MWATVRYLRKMIQTPTVSPCSSPQWETRRLGRPGGRALSGSVPGARQRGDTLPTWDQSSVFPAWVFLTLTLYLRPQSRSCFRCQSLVFSPAFRGIQKISRLSGQMTDLPNNYPTGKRHLPEELQPCNFETGVCSGWTLPSPTAVLYKQSAACALFPARGKGCPVICMVLHSDAYFRN